QRVGELVASGVLGRAVEDQLLDFGPRREHVVHGARDAVLAAADGFHDDIGHVVDDVEIVAHAADHAVGTGAAIDRVVAAAALDGVGALAAHQVVVAVETIELVVATLALHRIADAGALDRAEQHFAIVRADHIAAARIDDLRAHGEAIGIGHVAAVVLPADHD